MSRADQRIDDGHIVTGTADTKSLLHRVVEGLVILVMASAIVASLVAGGVPLFIDIVAMIFGEDGSQIGSASFLTVLLFGTILLIGTIGGLVCGLNPFALGTNRRWLLVGIGTFSGVFVIAFAASYAGLTGVLVPVGLGNASLPLLLLALVLTLLQTGAEEVYFRGWLQPALAQHWGIPPAMVLSSLSFCLLHFVTGIDSWISVLNIFLAGLLFGVLAAWGRGILGALAAHFAWNITEIHIFGLFPNPGESVYGALLDFDLYGPNIWGGSHMGLNASVSLTLALGLLLVPLVLALRKSVFTARWLATDAAR